MGLDDIMLVPSEKNSDLKKSLKKHISEDAKTKKKGIRIDNFLKLAKEGHFKEGSIHEVLEECELLFCSTPPPPRNPELEERISKLKAEQANAEYRSMTKSLLPPDKSKSSLREDINTVSSQVIAVINFVLTVGGTFCFVYKAVEYALPHQNIPAQVLVAILASIVVAVADIYFLLQTI
ncbi:transmembrane protein 199-like [Argiope bruennichi]|nr:transmembrane protein 199-like [Argiope bruennichi]